MFGHSIDIHCYIDRADIFRVYASPEKLAKDRHIEEHILTISHCCFNVYYNKITEEFSSHPVEGDENWVELPWQEWVDVNNPDLSNTFSHKFQMFAARITGK